MSRVSWRLLGVDGDGVAFFHERERAAERGLGGDVADDEAVRAAGEAAIGDQRHVFAEALAHDGAGGGEHLAHAGAADRAFVPDDDDVAFLHGAIEDAGEGVLLVFEDERFAGEAAGLPCR